MKTILAIKERVPLLLIRDAAGEWVEWTADMDVDCDGIGGNPFHDPDFQPDTALHHDGKALWAERVPYVVVPPAVREHTNGVVLGSLCECWNIATDAYALAVVGDTGPTYKIGEGSPKLCELLGLDPNPNHGGCSDFRIKYRVHVGKAALIDGVQYELQRAA